MPISNGNLDLSKQIHRKRIPHVLSNSVKPSSSARQLSPDLRHGPRADASYVTVARDGLLSTSYENTVPVALAMTAIKQRFAGGLMLLIVGLVASGPIRGNQSD